MLDVILLFGKLVLVGLMYLFLFAVVRAGLGVVSAGPSASGASFSPGATPWALVVDAGPAELRGVRVPLDASVTIGRSPEADITIADSFVSSRHARVSPSAGGPILEDLGSTNGTVVNGARIAGPTTLRKGDKVTLGDVVLKVERK
jgi:hypothetical protein